MIKRNFFKSFKGNGMKPFKFNIKFFYAFITFLVFNFVAISLFTVDGPSKINITDYVDVELTAKMKTPFEYEKKVSLFSINSNYKIERAYLLSYSIDESDENSLNRVVVYVHKKHIKRILNNNSFIISPFTTMQYTHGSDFDVSF